MKKSEKRRIGEARQAEFAQQNREQGLKAQQQAHEIAAKRKATAEAIAQRKKNAENAKTASEKMKAVGFSATAAAKSMSDFVTACRVDEEVDVDYPEVLDMTDETAYSA
jgi:hypothetical protein